MVNEWIFFQELAAGFASPIASVICAGVVILANVRSQSVMPAIRIIIGNKLTENLERRSKEKLTKVKKRLIKGSMMSKTNSPEELIRRKSSRLGHH